MRRAPSALVAAIALGALLPGAASALPLPGVLDQSSTQNDHSIGSSADLAQTFTAGKTGLLRGVQLWMNGSNADPLAVEIQETTSGLPNGTILATSGLGTPPSAPGWVTFLIGMPAPVVAGTAYAIVFNTGAHNAAWGSGDVYAGGQAREYNGVVWGPVYAEFQDFAFRTYVDAQSITLQWDKSQLTAGTSTALTLTETLALPSVQIGLLQAAPNVLSSIWTVNSLNLPAWFSVTGVTCSSQIAGADCIPANVAPGGSIGITPDGDPVTLVLAGTASPVAAGTASGKAEVCIDYTRLIADVAPGQARPAQVEAVCVSAEVAVAVVAPGATPGPTPPPTSVAGSPSPTEPGFVIWLLSIGMAAGASTLLLTSRRRGHIR